MLIVKDVDGNFIDFEMNRMVVFISFRNDSVFLVNKNKFFLNGK